MKKPIQLIITLATVSMIILAGCGGNPLPETKATLTDTARPTTTITTTSTPDLCESEKIRPVVDKVHRHMREFDDASTLAASIAREQLSGPIADLQRIRREAEDEVVPACLSSLKDYQVQHMNSVISTLLAFMGTNDPLAVDCVDVAEGTEEAAICQNIAKARQLHDQYTLELARILGIPIITATAGVTLDETATPTP